MLVLENETLKRENEINRRKSTESNNRPLLEAAHQINDLKLEVMHFSKLNQELERNIETAMKEFEPMVQTNQELLQIKANLEEHITRVEN